MYLYFYKFASFIFKSHLTFGTSQLLNPKLFPPLFSGTIADYDQLVEFAGQGMYCEYDLFGIDVSHYQLAPAVDMPNDAERIKRIKTLVDAGYGDKVLIAHDIHTKERLVSLFFG